MSRANGQNALFRRRRWTLAAGLAASLIVSGFGMSLALRSPAYSWLAWAALIPLFLSIRVLTPARALLAGAVWGVGLYGFSLITVATPIPASFSAFALLVASPAIYACLGAVVTSRIGFNPFVLGVGWIGVELVLAPLDLQHGLLAAIRGQGVLPSLLSSLLGAVFVGFVIACVTASFVSILGTLWLWIARLPRPASYRDRSRSLNPQRSGPIPWLLIPNTQPRAPPVVSSPIR